MIGRTTSKANRIAAAACATVAFVVLAASPSWAAQATQEGYSSPAESVQGQVQGGGGDGGASPAVAGQADPPVVATEASSSTLPFTGLELGGVLMIGVVLLLIGFAMRRAVRPRTPGNAA